MTAAPTRIVVLSDLHLAADALALDPFERVDRAHPRVFAAFRRLLGDDTTMMLDAER